MTEPEELKWQSEVSFTLPPFPLGKEELEALLLQCVTVAIEVAEEAGACIHITASADSVIGEVSDRVVESVFGMAEGNKVGFFEVDLLDGVNVSLTESKRARRRTLGFEIEDLVQEIVDELVIDRLSSERVELRKIAFRTSDQVSQINGLLSDAVMHIASVLEAAEGLVYETLLKSLAASVVANKASFVEAALPKRFATETIADQEAALSGANVAVHLVFAKNEVDEVDCTVKQGADTLNLQIAVLVEDLLSESDDMIVLDDGVVFADRLSEDSAVVSTDDDFAFGNPEAVSEEDVLLLAFVAENFLDAFDGDSAVFVAILGKTVPSLAEFASETNNALIICFNLVSHGLTSFLLFRFLLAYN